MDEEDLRRAIEASPHDATRRGVLADLLEERGDARAPAYRWLVDHQLRPAGPDVAGWWWWHQTQLDRTGLLAPFMVPAWLYSRLCGMRKETPEWKMYPTLRTAEEDFVRAWQS